MDGILTVTLYEFFSLGTLISSCSDSIKHCNMLLETSLFMCEIFLLDLSWSLAANAKVPPGLAVNENVLSESESVHNFHSMSSI